MKTIKRKISTPFLMIIFVIPFMIMVLFNLAMYAYVDRSSKEELRNAGSSIEILVRQQLVDSALDKTDAESNSDTGKNLTALREGLKVSKMSLLHHVKNMNVEFLLISSEGEVLFPSSFEDSFLSDQIIREAEAEFARAEEGEIIQYRVGRTKYYATYQMLTSRQNATRLAFISSGSQVKGFVRFINMILLSIIALAVVIGSSIALAVSRSLSLPISRLTAHAKKIGAGEFITLPEDRSSIEINELTNSMNEMSEQLKNYDVAQKSFLQNASHELRTPLMSIQGYAEGIVNGVFTDTKKTAEIICDESRRLNSLVEQLLTLSRIENKNYRSDMVCCNLSDHIKEYLLRINGYALREKKNIELKIPEDAIMVRIDDVLLLQAVNNIISNCIRYSKSAVTVSLFSENNIVVIKIHDDGQGISPEELSHIFERFFKGKKGEFGLGLAIAKSAVEFMDGRVTAYNENGAVFEIRLPLYRP